MSSNALIRNPKRGVSQVPKTFSKRMRSRSIMAVVAIIAILAAPVAHAALDYPEHTQSGAVPSDTQVIAEAQSTDETSQSSTSVTTEVDIVDEDPSSTGEDSSSTDETSAPDSASIRTQSRASSCPDRVVLNEHFGPTAGAPYRYQYVGNRSSQVKPITFNADGLYATTLSSSGLYGPVVEISDSSSEIPSVQSLFSSSYAGKAPTINNLYSAINGSWTGYFDYDLTTMALDGGQDGQRTVTGYFWSWDQARANPIGISPGPVSNWPNATNSIPVAVFPNGSAASAAGQPEDILFVPLPYPTTSPGQIIGYNYWSGGEVDQQTGHIYFTGGEDTSFGNTSFPARFMILDPYTGNYAASGNILPKTPEDEALFGAATNYLASDLVIDGQGDMYVLVYGVNTPIPNSTSSTPTKWLVKIDAQGGENGEWTYSGVMPLWFNTGTEENPIYKGVHDSPATIETWGSAFYNGKLYFTAGPSLYETDPLTGWTRQVPGTMAMNPYDLAAADPVAVLNGTVYDDANRNGVLDAAEGGLPNQLIQLYDVDGKLVGQQRTNASGEYSFLMPTEATYYLRLVQPQIDVGSEENPALVNAAQTGIDVPSACSTDTVTVTNFGTPHSLQAGPLRPDGSLGPYVDPPAASGGDSFAVADAPLVAKFDLNADSSVTTVDFGANATASWGDAGNDATTFNTLAANGGPRHVNPGNWEGDGKGDRDNPTTYLGTQPGWYNNGSIDGSHTTTDDGIHLILEEDEIPLNDNVVLAAGQEYTFRADVSGDRASSSTVRAWLSQPGSNTFASTSTSRSGSGDFSLTIPSGNWASPSPAWLRANATSSTNAIGNLWWNTNAALTKFYAPEFGSELSKTADWVIDGETEDYPVRIANGALRLEIAGAPGDYAFADFSNVVAAGTVEGSLPSGQPSTLLSTSLAVLSTASPVTFTITTIPPGSSISATEFALFDKDGNQLTQKASYNAATKEVTVPADAFTQVTDIRVLISTDTPSTLKATKELSPIAYASGAISMPQASEWEITATDTANHTTVISEGIPLELSSGETYVIGERLKTTASGEAAAFRLAGITCTDENGDPLPPEVFDEESATITATESNIAVECIVVNAASQITLYDSGTATLSGTDGDNNSFSLANDTSILGIPGSYSISAQTQSGQARIGISALDLEDTTCQDAWNERSTETIPSGCWLHVADPANAIIRGGLNNVFRVDTVSTTDLPSLPNAGGIGSYLYVIVSAVLIGAAAMFYLIRHRQRR